MRIDKLFPHLQICSLEAAREACIEAYGGVITIENSVIEEPFRIARKHPPQCIIRFDDVTFPGDDWILPHDRHVRAALKFAHQWEQPSLLIHCHAGMSRSPAIGLAILADWLGAGKEDEAGRELLKVARVCVPNKLVVEIADRILGRDGALLKAFAVINE